MGSIVAFVYNASGCGFEIVPDAYNAAMHKLSGLTSKVATALFKKVFLEESAKKWDDTKTLPDWWIWAIYQYIEDPEEDIAAAALRGASSSDAVKIVDKIGQTSTCLSLLKAHSGISNSEARARLLSRLSEDTATQFVLKAIDRHSVRKWMEDDLMPFDDAVAVVGYAKESETVVKVVAAMLKAFASYEEACKGSWVMSWDSKERGKVDKLLKKLPNTTIP